jgi:hypothetical protein
MIEEVGFVDTAMVRPAVRPVISDPFWLHVTYNCLRHKAERRVRVPGRIRQRPGEAFHCTEMSGVVSSDTD